MKIIQISTAFNSSNGEYRTFGLGDDGKVYYWLNGEWTAA
jgi:hypothetical protein